MYIVYIFEDKDDSPISRLIDQHFYSLEKHRIFAGGSGNLEKRAKEVINAGNFPVVLLDTVPNSNKINETYVQLLIYMRKSDYKGTVFPIVCAEYYYLSSLQNLPVVYENYIDTMQRCLDKEDHLKEDFIYEYPKKDGIHLEIIESFYVLLHYVNVVVYHLGSTLKILVNVLIFGMHVGVSDHLVNVKRDH